MRKKLLLVNPNSGVNSQQAGIMNYPPLGLGYIAALTPSDWDIEIHDENIERLINIKEADLVGFTAMTSNAPRAYELAAKYRERGIPTVMGGIHASMMSDEAERYVDAVVVGEAESVWPQLIIDFENKGLKSRYKGEWQSLDNLVVPRRDLYPKDYKIKNTLLTTRGCPHACDFCTVTTFNGRKYRHRPIHEVVNEIEKITEHSEGLLRKLFTFVDDDILGYGTQARERAKNLFRAIIERGLDIRWNTQTCINFAFDHEVLELAQRSGCRGVFIGIESISENVLKRMKKNHNIKTGLKQTEYYKQAVKNLHQYGIPICGALVFGYDGEERDIFKKTVDFILEVGVDASYLCMLAPLPGTRLLGDYLKENRIFRNNFPDDWKYFNTWDLTFKPKGMSCTELEDGLKFIYEQTMSWPTSLIRAGRSAIATKDIYSTLIPFFWNIGYGAAFRDNCKTPKPNSFLPDHS